jgi:hypothetical protein
LATVPQSLNRYPYVVNNPVNFVDPAGLQVAEGTLVLVCSSGAGCAVVVVGAGVAACASSPACRGWVAAGAEEAWGFVTGLFSKKEPKPVYQPYPKEEMVGPWTPASPGDLLPPNFQPPTRGPGKWMWRSIILAITAAAAERSGVFDMCVPPPEAPPKE